MDLHIITRGEVTLRPAGSVGERDRELTPSDVVEVSRGAIAHIYGNARTLFAFGKSRVYVHGHVDDVYVLGESTVFMLGSCGRATVSMHGTLMAEKGCGSALVIAKQNGVVISHEHIKVLAFGEATIYAPATADVVLHWYSRWHTDDGQVHGLTDTYRPGYVVVR